MLLLLVQAWASPVIQPVVEPVASHARQDVRHVRATPFYSMGVIAGPVLYGLGHLSLSLRVRRDVPTVRDYGFSATGGLLMALAPTMLSQRASLSRRALEAQGLRPTRYPLYLTMGLTVVGALLAVAGQQTSNARIRMGRRPNWRLTAAGVGVWTIGVSLPVLQLRANRRARHRAGWTTR